MEGGGKTIKTVNRHFGFPRLHLCFTITTHKHTHFYRPRETEGPDRKLFGCRGKHFLIHPNASLPVH